MPTSESQKRASHNRYHRDKNVVSSKCAICCDENPTITGEVVLNSEPKIEILREDNSKPILGARVFVHPVLQAPDPTKTDFDEQLERDTLWRYAALRRSIEEVAKVMNCSPKEMAEKVIRNFKTDWDSLSERAFLEMQFEVEANIYARARGNDARFVLLYERLKGLPGYIQGDLPPSKRYTPPKVHELELLSFEELLKRRADLSKIIDRPPSFTVSVRTWPY
jgi:hypothetical protein